MRPNRVSNNPARGLFTPSCSIDTRTESLPESACFRDLQLTISHLQQCQCENENAKRCAKLCGTIYKPKVSSNEQTPSNPTITPTNTVFHQRNAAPFAVAAACPRARKASRASTTLPNRAARSPPTAPACASSSTVLSAVALRRSSVRIRMNTAWMTHGMIVVHPQATIVVASACT